MDDALKKDTEPTIMKAFEVDENLIELANVDDLWYFVKGKTGAWVAGSGGG